MLHYGVVEKVTVGAVPEGRVGLGEVEEAVSATAGDDVVFGCGRIAEAGDVGWLQVEVRRCEDATAARAEPSIEVDPSLVVWRGRADEPADRLSLAREDEDHLFSASRAISSGQPRSPPRTW